MRLITNADLESCAEKVQLLVSAGERFRDIAQASDEETRTGNEADGAELQDISRQRYEARRHLKSKICMHRLIPTGIGKGRGKLEQKVKSLVRKLLAETQSLPALHKFLSQIRGFCTDAGTEQGVADVAGCTVSDMLKGVLAEELESEDAVHGSDPSHHVVHVFENALLSPGSLHIHNNMILELDTKLEMWDWWLPGFKAIVKLFHSNHVRQKFIATCILDTDHAWLRDRADRQIREPASWRWGSIQESVSKVLKMKYVLRVAWKPHLYSAGEGRVDNSENPGQREREDPLDLDAITASVESGQWWLYTEAIQNLHFLGDSIREWFEGCPCHEHIGSGFECDRDITDLMRTACASSGLPFEDVISRCPLRGIRGQELANGKFWQFFEAAASMYNAKVLEVAGSEMREGLEADLQSVVADFSKGKSFMSQYLQLKLNCWNVLPWSLVALTSRDPCLVQRCGQKILADWERSPKKEELHHRATWSLFGGKIAAEATATASEEQSAEGLRAADALALQELRSLVSSDAGVLSRTKHPILWKQAWEMYFLPTVERIQEADHAQVNIGVGKRRVGGSYVSCLLRGPEIRELLHEPPAWAQFLQQYPRIQNVDEMAMRLGFFHVPRWQELCKQKLRHSEKLAAANKVLYILDPESQFASVQKAREKRQKHEDKKKKQRQEYFSSLGLAGDSCWAGLRSEHSIVILDLKF